MKTSQILSCIVVISVAAINSAFASPPTAAPIIVQDVLLSDSAFDGYTLFAPKDSTFTYLVDNQGKIINQWESQYHAGTNAELLKNGHIIRASSVGYDGNPNIHTPFAGGIIEEFDWQGNLVWQYHYNDAQVLQHHFIDVMPNGNVLMLAYDYISKDQAIAAGRDPEKLTDGFLTPDHVAEVKKTGSNSGEIVWEWHAFDHLIQDVDESKANYGKVAEHPEKININYTPPSPSPLGADWNHASSASYNEVTNQVVIGVANFNEVWVIDHNTTTEEAKGVKGDLVFRWGNPEAYGVEKDQTLDSPHNAIMQDDGSITVVNYGKSKDKYSSIVFIKPANSVTEAVEYQRKFSNEKLMFTGFDFLANGNALIIAVGGKLIEMTPEGKIIWQLFNLDSGTDMLKTGDKVPMRAAIPGQPMPKFPANYVLTAQKYAKDFVNIK